MEAEWEFAARGGILSNGYMYSGSNALNTVGWFLENSNGAACGISSSRGTWPVGQKLANELGIHDMSGNVWEWCWDANGVFRLIRGGSWNFPDFDCTVFKRGDGGPNGPSTSIGFRLARSSGQ
jgi:formylglycine-generating enzyme required for sulfatase activity